MMQSNYRYRCFRRRSGAVIYSRPLASDDGCSLALATLIRYIARSLNEESRVPLRARFEWTRLLARAHRRAKRPLVSILAIVACIEFSCEDTHEASARAHARLFRIPRCEPRVRCSRNQNYGVRLRAATRSRISIDSRAITRVKTNFRHRAESFRVATLTTTAESARIDECRLIRRTRIRNSESKSLAYSISIINSTLFRVMCRY